MTGWGGSGHLAGASTYGGWDELLTNNPKVLWGLIADVVKAIKAGEGEKRTGRRPSVSVHSLDELYELLFPPAYYHTEPFPQALHELLRSGGHSQRSFACAIGFNQATVSRLLSGKSAPTPELMERIAYTVNARPTYFIEYRAAKLGQVIADVLVANPQLSAAAAQRLVGAT